MDLLFGKYSGLFELGDYCRSGMVGNKEIAYDVNDDHKNNIWEKHKKMFITNKLISLFDKLPCFDMAELNGYKLREEPTLIKWTYDGGKKGAASHYHHDAWDGVGDQVSLMLLLEENVGQTHMRIIQSGRKTFFHFLYERISFCKLNYLFAINDLLIEAFYNPTNLEGEKDDLFFFNAGLQLHKAFPVKGTTRSIMHLNLTKGDSRLNMLDLQKIDKETLPSSKWQKLLPIT